MSQKIYEMVTNRIIEQLEKGVVPWRKPFTNAGVPMNWKTQRPYRGINTILLPSGEFATFKQIKEAGGTVKKGEKGHIVVFWKWLESKDEDTGETETFPMLRYYTVFEINTQATGLESKRPIAEAFDHDPIEKAEEILAGYINGPEVFHESGRACYFPLTDRIQMPPMKDFEIAEEYYSVYFHEACHSTGAKSRLKRKGIIAGAKFGDSIYSQEELVAEMGAAMLCGAAGIDNVTVENSAAYIQSWLRVLKGDSKLVVQASQQAQKAVDYIYPAVKETVLNSKEVEVSK